MNANPDIERRIADFYASEGPGRAPDWVLRSALETIDTTPQRRVVIRVPWRLPDMNVFAKVAVAALVVVAIVALGLNVLRPPASSSVGGPPTASPSPSPSPSTSAGPSPIAPPALTETYRSERHGISISYPAGWVAQSASVPWTTSADPVFSDPSGDFLSDPARDAGHLFIVLASQPISTTFEEWTAASLTGECTASEPVVVDGAEGVFATGCSLAFVPSGGRVYLIRLYKSGDDDDLRALDTDAWLKDILATVQLQPEDAVDSVASASP